MIPQVRAVAGGLLASTAILGVIIGLASQQTLGNFIAGILIAMTQPVRIGDRVSYADEDGVVEEIGLTYTFIRTADRRRLVVPNSKLASDPIVNSSIRSRETFAEVSVPVPLAADLDAAVDALREDVADERDASVYISSLDGTATVTVRAVAGTSSRRSGSSTSFGCARTGGCARSASGREPQAQGQAEAATEAAQAPRSSSSSRSPSRSWCSRPRRPAAPSTSARAAT